MLWVTSLGWGADLVTSDPESWASYGLGPSAARSFDDPITSEEVPLAAILDVGFGDEEVDGGALLRFGATRVFLGVDALNYHQKLDGAVSDVETGGDDQRYTYDSGVLPLQLDAATRVGGVGLSLALRNRHGESTLTMDGGALALGSSAQTDTRTEDGSLVANVFQARLLAQFGPTEGEVRPRVAPVLLGSTSLARVDFDATEDQDGVTVKHHFEGEGTTLLSGGNDIGLPLEGDAWRVGGGVRGGVDLGGTNADPRTRVWGELTARGGAPILGETTESITVDGETSTYRYTVEDAGGWQADVEAGVVHRLGGDDAAAWLGARGWYGHAESQETERVVLTDHTDGETTERSTGADEGGLTLTLAGHADLAPTVRVLAGLSPRFALYGGREKVGSKQTWSSSAVSIGGRLGLVWHHPKGFYAAIGTGFGSASDETAGISGGGASASSGTSSIVSLFSSDTALWVGWAPSAR